MILKNDVSKLPVLAEGGEGIIYEYRNKLIKAYKPHVNLATKEKKVKLLMAKNLPSEIISPIDIVYNSRNKFIGYIMNKVDGEEFKKLSNKKFVKSNSITKKEILKMLDRLFEVLVSLHNQGIYIGDLNDQNILFDKNYNIFIIDCDSWSIDDEKCDVAMDLFKDPLLVSNNFDKKTDTYAFSVLSWKSLTRIHPFGGTTQSDMNIMERMRKGISVIDNSKVTIPKTIGSWAGLSPELINALKAIFENRSRELHGEIHDLSCHLKYCDVDKDYYYDKYNVCPVCDSSAKINRKPINQGVQSGLQLIELLLKSNIKAVIDETMYIDTDDNVVDIKSGRKCKHKNLIKYHFHSDGFLIEEDNNTIIIHSNKDYELDKKFKSRVILDDDKLYYISKQNTLTEVTITKNGNSFRNMCKCSDSCYFEVSKGKYCVVNYYRNKIIFDINGTNHIYNYNERITNYGIHYDCVSNKWLVILENDTNNFLTLVFKDSEIQYECDKIKYDCSLGNVCMSNSTIFFPIDGKIRGFAYVKDMFKDFQCSIVDYDSKLIKNGKKFIIVNDENIYALS